MGLPDRETPHIDYRFHTKGFIIPGVGSAAYRLAADQAGSASPSRARSKDGRWFELDEATPTPEMFGSIGDGSSHPAAEYFRHLTSLQAIYPFAQSLVEEMDWLGWQAALNHGGGIRAGAAKYVMCSRTRDSQRPLEVVAGRSWVEGFGCTLDFSRFELPVANRSAKVTLPCAVHLTRDGAAEHYPIYQPLRGLRIVGPGTGHGLVGARWSSQKDLDGNLAVFEQSSFTGFDIGFSFEAGAYLTVMYDVLINACGVCVSYTGGRNSGENFRFFGGSIANSEVALTNSGGAEFTFFGTAMDYLTQCIVQNRGRIELHGVHAEMPLPARSGKPLFECIQGGSINWFGGMFLGAGEIGAAAEPPIRLTSPLCRMGFFGTQLYNLTSRAGVACSGMGTLSAQGWQNSGNPNIGPALISDARNQDLFGGAGSFEPSGDLAFLATPNGPNLPGGIYGQAHAEATDRWTSRFLSAAITNEFAHSNSHSLALTKRGESAGGPDNQFVIFVPVQATQNAWVSLYWLQPKHIVSNADNAPLFVRGFWVQQIGTDTLGRPLLADNAVFTGEKTIKVPFKGSLIWTRWLHNTTFVQSDQNSAGRSSSAPARTTHLAIVFDTQSLPPMTIYLDDIVANAL